LAQRRYRRPDDGSITPLQRPLADHARYCSASTHSSLPMDAASMSAPARSR